MAEIYFNYKINSIKNFKYYAESAGTIADDTWIISGGAAHALLENNIQVTEAFHSTSLT